MWNTIFFNSHFKHMVNFNSPLIKHYESEISQV